VPTIGLARLGPKELSLYVWIYCIICWFIQDAAKVGTYKLLKAHNIFGINDIVKMYKEEVEEKV
jgi:hypothetical protein